MKFFYFGAILVPIHFQRHFVTVRFLTLDSTEQYLHSLINYEQTFPLGGTRSGLKLEPCLNAAERLGLDLRLPHCVHVAGTKGKGSTVAFLEALLAPDCRTLSFTSPHLESVIERIRLNGRPLDDALWCRSFSEFVPMLERDPAIKLTYFETAFIFYLWAARELKPDVHLVEVGLGGRWDATNILKDTLAVITTIDYDHTEILGNTLTEIAADKAGIIKPDSHVIIGRQPDEALVTLKSAVLKAPAQAL
ncbi:hypothetical protein EHM69_05415, partial [candidate division KSB1 bacterium]